MLMSMLRVVYINDGVVGVNSGVKVGRVKNKGEG